MTFGERLYALRKKKGWPRARLAKPLGLSATFIRDVEVGIKAPPSAGRIREICELLGGDAETMLKLAGKSLFQGMQGRKPEVEEVMATLVSLYESGKLTIPLARGIRSAIEGHRVVASAAAIQG